MRKRPVVHAMGRDRRAHRRGKTKGKIGLWQGRDRAAKASQLRGQVAMNKMLINISTRVARERARVVARVGERDHALSGQRASVYGSR